MGDNGRLSDASGRLGGDSDVSGVMGELRWRACAIFEINSDAGMSEMSGVLKARYKRWMALSWFGSATGVVRSGASC